MNTRFFYIFIVLILFSIFNGCKQDDSITEVHTNKENEDSIKISTNYVNINWDKVSIVNFDNKTGNIELQFTEDPLSIKTGNIFVLVVNDSTSSIRKVQNSTLKGSICELQTTEGSMSDIFTSGSFTLNSSEVVSRSSEKTNIFYPEKIVYNNGTSCETRGEISGKLLNTSIPFSQIKLWESSDEKSKFTYDSGSLGIGLNLLMEFNFGNKKELIEKVTNNLMRLKVSMIGSLDIEYSISYTTESKLEIGETEILKKKNIIAPKYLWFNVQGVLVLVTIKSDLLADFQLSAEGKLNAKVGANYNITTKSGFEYNQSTNKVTNFSENSKSIDVIPPVISGEATVNFRPSLYPRFFIYFYGLVGPTLDIKPYVDFTAKAKFLQNLLINQTPFSALEFVTSLGLNLQSHFHYKPFDQSNDKDILMLDKDLINIEIFRSPYKILKSTNNTKSINNEKEVIFTVYDTLPFSRKIQPTSQPLSVRISNKNSYENKIINSDGTISYKYDSAKPTTIEASIYSTNGSQISNIKHEVDERDMLIAFYKSTNGDKWTRNDNWCSEKPISEWYGVKTETNHYSMQNRVRSLILPNNNLTGSAYLAHLRSIQNLNILDGNNIESLTIDNCGNEFSEDSLGNYNQVFYHDYNYTKINLRSLNISNSNALIYVNGNFSADFVKISNCQLSPKEYIYFDLPTTIIKNMTVSNCTMGYFYANNSIIDNISIENCTFLDDAYIYTGNRTVVNNCKGLRKIYHRGFCSDLIVTNTTCGDIHCGEDEKK